MGLKTTQDFPSYVGTQCVRELSLRGAGNIPVDIGFVPSRAQQNRSPAHPGVLKALRYPQKEEFPRWVDSARDVPPTHPTLRWGDPRLAALQPSLDVAPTQGTPVLSLKVSAVGLPAKGLIFFFKGREKG